MCMYIRFKLLWFHCRHHQLRSAMWIMRTVKRWEIQRCVGSSVLVCLLLWLTGVFRAACQRTGICVQHPDVGPVICNPPLHSLPPEIGPAETGPPCSLKILRDYYVEKNFFPGQGLWEEDNFRPQICSFLGDCHKGTDERERWRTCLSKANISHVVVLGDSNGELYFRQLIATATHVLRMTCRMENSEVLVRNPDGSGYVSTRDFYSRHNDKVVLTYRPCHTCESAIYRCTPRDKEGSKVIFIEYLAWYFVKNATVTIRSNHFSVNGTHLDNSEDQRYQTDMFYDEFLFRYHLRGRMPSHLLVLPPFNHLKRWTDSRVRTSLKWFLDMAHGLVPPTAKIVVLPSMREYQQRLAERFRNETIFGDVSTERIRVLNHVLFDLLRPHLLSENSRTYSFFDLWAMSGERDEWSLDGIHMRAEWYNKVIAFLLQTYCQTSDVSS